jgi:hypothetical protein
MYKQQSLLGLAKEWKVYRTDAHKKECTCGGMGCCCRCLSLSSCS